MTKKNIKIQLDTQSKGGSFWNSTATIEGIKVARVCFHTNQYKVIPSNATFDDVADRAYKPLAVFYYQDELINYIYNKVNPK